MRHHGAGCTKFRSIVMHRAEQLLAFGIDEPDVLQIDDYPPTRNGGLRRLPAECGLAHPSARKPALQMQTLLNGSVMNRHA
jgi:hypothetical protein